MSEPTAPDPESDTSLDPAQLQFAMVQLRSQQNLLGGLLAGVAAAGFAAAIWAGVTVATGFQIGWMAVAVGFLVGIAIRQLGRGIDTVFGIMGAVLSGVGCAAGNLLAVCALVANQEGLPFFDLLARVDFEFASNMMVATFSPIDLVFYGVAIYEGYKLSFRRVTPEELSRVLHGSAGVPAP